MCDGFTPFVVVVGGKYFWYEVFKEINFTELELRHLLCWRLRFYSKKDAGVKAIVKLLND